MALVSVWSGNSINTENRPLVFTTHRIIHCVKRCDYEKDSKNMWNNRNYNFYHQHFFRINWLVL